MNREGILDVVAIQWSVGALVGGVLTPPTGSLTITPNQRSVVIPLTVSFTALSLCNVHYVILLGYAHHTPQPVGGVFSHSHSSVTASQSSGSSG